MSYYESSNFEYDFSTQLFQKLKERVNGKVYVNIANDEVYVEITYKFDTWCCRTNGFTERYVVNGWDSDTAAEEYLRLYKGFILSKYFKSEKRESYPY